MKTTAFSDGIAALAGRAALEIRPGGLLVIGKATARHDPDDPTSLLTTYLTMVRRLRGQRRAVSIVLRRDDITMLADALGRSAVDVVEQLGSLMGATRSQRAAMATMFAAGALVIGLSASGVTGSSAAGAAASAPTVIPSGDSPSAAAAERPSAARFAPLLELAADAASDAAEDGSIGGVASGPMAFRPA